MIKWQEIIGDEISNLTEIGLTLKIHPLAVEDCFHKDQRPKLDDFGTHQFLVWFMVCQGKFYEIQFIIFPDQILLVTDNLPPREKNWFDFFNLGTSINEVWHMIYRCLDFATDTTWEEIRKIFGEIEVLEDSIFKETFNPKSIIELKKTLNRMEGIIEGLYSIPNQIEKFDKGKNGLSWKLRDLHDHCERMYQSVSMHSNQVGMVIDLYWGYQSDRINKQMKRITLLASIAIPVTFWASFWGMNFNTIPFDSPFLFYLALIVMVLSVVFATWFLIKKGYWSD
jgi:magnesium transporter